MTETSQWAVDEGKWTPVRGVMKNELNPGIYQLDVKETPFSTNISLREMTALENDNITPLPGSLAEYIVMSIETFWKKEHLYKEMGLIHKRGVLLEGAPGTGKTAICMIVGKEIADRGGVAVFTAPSTPIAFLPEVLKTVRKMHPALPVLNIMEDIDKQRHHIDELLPMLDGETQISNVIHLATTNFVDKLDSRLTNRPSRFDEVICARSPKKATREAYLRSILPADMPERVLVEMVKQSQNLNFAHLKELAICTHVYGRPIEKTVERLQRLADRKASGFGKDDDDD